MGRGEEMPVSRYTRLKRHRSWKEVCGGQPRELFKRSDCLRSRLILWSIGQGFPLTADWFAAKVCSCLGILAFKGTH